MDDESVFTGEEEDEKRVANRPDAGPKSIFRKELKGMLFGFGDEKEPYEQTVEALEWIVLEYIKELCLRALEVGKPAKIQLEDIHYLIRRDTKKFARVRDLLSISEELKKARKQFEDATAPE